MGAEDSESLVMWMAYAAFHLGDYQKSGQLLDELIVQPQAEPVWNFANVSGLTVPPLAGQHKEAYDTALKTGSGLTGACPAGRLQNRLLFHLAHKLNDENKLMIYHQKLTDDTEDQTSDRHEHVTVVSSFHPLPAKPLPGGHRHLQAIAPRKQRIHCVERVRGSVLLQAGLLRRVARDPPSLPAAAPRECGCHQPEGLQPLPAVQRQGGRGGAEDAGRQAGRSDHAVRQRPDPAQSLRVPQRRERPAGAPAARRRDPGGAAQPRDLPPALPRVQGGAQPNEGHRAFVSRGVHPQGRRQRLHRPGPFHAFPFFFLFFLRFARPS
eukprot:2526055-Rhodomonas_salina.1